MSWIAKLNDTYDAISEKDNSNLWPISHFFKKAHIEVVVDSNGDFMKGRARTLEDSESGTLIPATEASAGRAGAKIAPHPLCEELGYCAGDLPGIDDKKHRAYMDLLRIWCSSEHKHPKANAILKYLEKGRLWKDLLSSGIDFPISSTTPPEKTFIRWRVESFGEPESGTWEDQDLIDSWTKHDAKRNHRENFCYVTGLSERPAENHPKFLRHSADGAKIISSNDSGGYTYRGRFVHASQAASISFSVSQKAHNALRWLIQNQGKKFGEARIVAWAASAKEIPEPFVEITQFDLDDFGEITGKPTADYVKTEFDHTIDIGQSYARNLNKYMAGYRAELSPTDTISVMAIDSATPGRMGITYYREYLPPEYLEQITRWHTEFAWFQRVTKEISQAGGKSKTIVIWPLSTPSPSNIMYSIYGDMLKGNEPLKRNFFERLTPSIIEGSSIPQDFVIAAFNQACNPAGKETWEWEKCLGVACSLYRGFCIRHPQTSKRKEFAMSLETSNTSRDYLYGRLLAIAERIEEIAHSAADVKGRPTTANRLMQRFSDRPFSTWPTIYKQLDPYMQQLKTSRPGFLTNRMKELDEVMNLFDPNDFKLEKKLTGEFLLGFHAQRLALRSKSQAYDTDDTTKSTKE